MITNSKYNKDAFILKLDSNLNISNKIRYQAIYNNKLEEMTYPVIYKAVDNGYLMLNNFYARNFDSQNNNFVKYDENFNVEWQKTYGEELFSDDKIVDLIQLDSTYILVGDIREDGHIARMDKNGNMLWSKKINSKGVFFWLTHVVQISETEFIFQGYDHIKPNNYRQLIGKFDIEGDVKWIKRINTNKKLFLSSMFYNKDEIFTFGILDNKIFINKISESGDIIEYNLYVFDNNISKIRFSPLNFDGIFKAIGYFNVSDRDDLFTMEFSEDLEFLKGVMSNMKFNTRLFTRHYFEEDELLSVQYKSPKNNYWDITLSRKQLEDVACEMKTITNVKKNDFQAHVGIENIQFSLSDFNNTLETTIKEVEFNIFPSILCESTCYSEFNYDDFRNIDKLTIVGDAKQKSNILELTTDDYFRNSGVWYEDKVDINNSFTTEFSFIFSKGVNELNDGSLPGADGITFVIQNSSNNSLGTSEGGLGYQGISNGIAFELDTYKNFEFNDQNGNHFAIQNNGFKTLSALHSDSTTIAINNYITEIKSDGSQEYFIKIVYQNKKLEIFLSETNQYSSPILSLSNFNINDYIFTKDGKAYVGITSATGNSRQQHDLLSWKFCASEGHPNSIVSNDKELNLPYPNPATNYIIIPHLFLNTQTVLYNSMGQPILNIDFNQKNNRLILDKLTPGAYFLKSNKHQLSFIKK